MFKAEKNQLRQELKKLKKRNKRVFVEKKPEIKEKNCIKFKCQEVYKKASVTEGLVPLGKYLERTGVTQEALKNYLNSIMVKHYKWKYPEFIDVFSIYAPKKFLYSKKQKAKIKEFEKVKRI
jgi:hypothetical protein